MNNDVRIALAANLSRGADTLDRLAIRLADGLTKLESLDESQAYIDAGAAVWEAVLRGFITVPEIVARVEDLKLCGVPEPDTITDNGMQSSNLFFSVMSDYIYPLGEAVAPYESLGNSEQWPRTDDDEILFRRNELKAEATGCRILARIIETHTLTTTPPAATANDARDKWLYRQCCKPDMRLEDIRRKLAKKKNWAPLDSIQGITKAANRFASRNNLPDVPSRQPGRPQQKK